MQKKDTIQMRVSVPINFAFTTPFRQAGLIFFFWCKKIALKHKGITVSLAQPQQEEAFFSPGYYSQLMVGELEELGNSTLQKKKNLLMEKAKKVKR